MAESKDRLETRSGKQIGNHRLSVAPLLYAVRPYARLGHLNVYYEVVPAGKSYQLVLRIQEDAAMLPSYEEFLLQF